MRYITKIHKIIESLLYVRNIRKFISRHLVCPFISESFPIQMQMRTTNNFAVWVLMRWSSQIQTG